MLKIYQVADDALAQYEVSLNGQAARLNSATVSAVPYSTHWPGRQRSASQTERAPFLRFESDERVHVIVKTKKTPSRAVLRPLSAGVKVALSGNEVRFTLARPGNYALEIDGPHSAIHIFFSPIQDFDAREGDENTLYFGPGIHFAGEIRLTSNQTMYIAPEATVYGYVLAVNAENVRVCGFGILDGSQEKRGSEAALMPSDAEEPFDLTDEEGFLKRKRAMAGIGGGVQFYGCKRSEITGVTIRDTALPAIILANCERVRIDNVKSIGMWRYNSGGLYIVNSEEIRMEGLFIRAFDDCVAVKGVCGFDSRPCENVLARRLTIWCDWGRDIIIGCDTHADEITSIVFEDCDLIHGAHARMGILSQNRADVHHVEFRNIRAEFSRDHQTPVYQTDTNAPYSAPRASEQPAVADIAVYEAAYADEDERNGVIRDIIFKDIYLRMDDGLPAPEFRVQGLSGAHDVRGVYIDGFYVNGMRVRAYSRANIFVNAFASKVVFS